MATSLLSPKPLQRLCAAGALATLCTLALTGLLCVPVDVCAQAAQSTVQGGAGTAMVTGSGRLATESRTLPPFEAISLQGPMRLVIRQGAAHSAQLRADDNLLPLIVTRVVLRGGVATLEIGAREGSSFTTRSEMVVSVETVTLRALANSASGDVELQALQTSALSLTVSGSGGVQAAGRTDKLAIEITGSGAVDAGRLDSAAVTVAIAGSGDADVLAHRSLTVSIAGSGGVTHAGEAQAKTAITGSGSVRRR